MSEDSDRDLLYTFRRWLPLDRKRLAVERLPDDQPGWDALYAVHGKPWHDLMRKMIDMPARTPEGIQAKARVLQAILRSHLGFGSLPEPAGTAAETFAWSLVTDMLGKDRSMSGLTRRGARPDAELLRLCAEFYACDEQVNANEDEPVWVAWLKKRDVAADAIQDMVPATDEGLRAKAGIAVFLLEENGEEELMASDWGRMTLFTLRNVAGRGGHQHGQDATAARFPKHG